MGIMASENVGGVPGGVKVWREGSGEKGTDPSHLKQQQVGN